MHTCRHASARAYIRRPAYANTRAEVQTCEYDVPIALDRADLQLTGKLLLTRIVNSASVECF